jgi:glyoxylase-like metal-dependent hydrolase (beta-lactamase superfamily II)
MDGPGAHGEIPGGGELMKRLLVAVAIIGSVRLQADDAIRVLKLRNSVSMVQTPGGNITVLVFPEGVTLVDTGGADTADQVLATIRTLSTQPIRYIINTTFDPGHIGGNDRLGSIGIQITGGNVAGQVGTDGAEIIAHENVLERMSARSNKPPYPGRAMPQTTYHVDSIKLSTTYHGDGIQVFHVPHAHTDADSLVYLRHSDVLATGDVLTTTAYPMIDIERGGSINGVVDALNTILDIAFPEFRLEGGTLIVPGHGRVCDSADVAYYRDLVTIVRDRVQDMKKKGMTLDQVKAARPTRDYDPRYGSGEQFVEAIYKSLPK